MRYIEISQDMPLTLNIINKTSMNMCIQPLYGCRTSFIVNKKKSKDESQDNGVIRH